MSGTTNISCTETDTANRQSDASVNIRVLSQGAPRFNAGLLHRSGCQIVAICLDMHSKYCEVIANMSSDCPRLFITATERALHLDESKPRESFTELEFTDYEGWSVWSVDSGRYTINVCLVDDSNQQSGSDRACARRIHGG